MPNKTSDPIPEPEPPAIPRIRSQVFSSGGVMTTSGPALLCPRCGQPTLTFLRITTFDRQTDERSMHFIRVEDDITTRHHIVAARGTPLERHRGCTIEFGCTSCISVYDDMVPVPGAIGHGIWLEVAEDHGICVLTWILDPTPEDHYGQKALQEASQEAPEAS